MTVLRKLFRFTGLGSGTGMGWRAGLAETQRFAPAEQAALRLYSLPRGFRQRSRYSLLNV